MPPEGNVICNACGGLGRLHAYDANDNTCVPLKCMICNGTGETKGEPMEQVNDMHLQYIERTLRKAVDAQPNIVAMCHASENEYALEAVTVALRDGRIMQCEYTRGGEWSNWKTLPPIPNKEPK